jgi:hypothetical protein
VTKIKSPWQGTLVRLMIALTVIAAFGAFAAPVFVSAGTQNGCQSGDGTKVRIWENAIGDTSDGDDSLWKCGSDSDLSNDDHTLPGNCHVSVVGGGSGFDWNDCASSITVYLTNGQRLCLFEDANYNGQRRGFVDAQIVRYNLNTSTLHNDSLSSLWIGSSATTCAEL